jgi:tetratricopeptide (TPR) repeat protein
VEWRDSKQRPLKDNSLRSVLKDLERKGLLTKAKNYENYSVPHLLQDFVIQDCVSTGWFEKFSTGPKAVSSYFYDYRDETLAVRGLRIAFYTADAKSFQERFRYKTALAARLLNPFNRSIYDRLPKAIKLLYLQGMVQQQIMGVSSTSEALQVFDDLNKKSSDPEPLHLGSSLDLAIARGDLDTLKQLNAQSISKTPEIEACYCFLKGDFEKAKSLFAKAMPLRKNSRKSSLAMERLPALLYSLLLFRENSNESTQMGYSLITACIKGDKNIYADVFGVINAALSFQKSAPCSSVLACLARN